MSSEQGQETVKQALNMGAQAYLFKPVRREELTTLWQHVWRSKGQETGTSMRRSAVASRKEGAPCTTDGRQSTEGTSTSLMCFTGRLSNPRAPQAAKSGGTVDRRCTLGSDDSASTMPGSSEGSPGWNLSPVQPAGDPLNDCTSDFSRMHSGGDLRPQEVGASEDPGPSGRLELTIQPLDLQLRASSMGRARTLPREPTFVRGLSGRLMELAQVAEKAEQVPTHPLPDCHLV